MDYLFLTARLIHVVLGVFWAGALVFSAIFVFPSVRDAGPEGAKVAAGMLRRRYLDVLPAAATLTVFSGLWLYWRMSGGILGGYMLSRSGLVYGFGGACSLVALVLGLAIMRPATLRAAKLTQSAVVAPSPERETQLATAQALRVRAAATGRVVAGLLVVTTLTMALGRYL